MTTAHCAPCHVQMVLEPPTTALDLEGLGPAEQGGRGMRGEMEAGGNPGGVSRTCLFSSCRPRRAQEPVCGRGLAVAEDEAVAEP